MAAAPARAALESLLRDRKLDTTLTTALPVEWTGGGQCVPTGLTQLDSQLRGGIPRGQISEVVGARSSGRTSVLRALMTEATRSGELVALVDTLDRFDPTSAAAAGVDLTRVLWVRGRDVPVTQPALTPEWEPSRPRPGGMRESVMARGVDRAIKALNLVLQSGGFGLVGLDLADVPLDAVRELPFNTWMRLQRVIEGSDTACVILADVPVARSAGGVSIRLQGQRTSCETLRPASRGATVPILTRMCDDAVRQHDDAADSVTCVSGEEHAREGLAPAAFHAAVLASRRPFVQRAASRGVAGRWAGSTSPLARLRGLATQASVVRAQQQPQPTPHVALEFDDG
jgi:hypothetical protein